MVVDDGGKVQVDIVLGHADLLWNLCKQSAFANCEVRNIKSRHTNYLDLDINLNETLGQRIDLDKTRVNSAVKSPKLGHKPDIALRNGLVWIRADDAARNSSAETDTCAKRVNYGMLGFAFFRAIRSAYSCYHTSHARQHRRREGLGRTKAADPLDEEVVP